MIGQHHHVLAGQQPLHLVGHEQPLPALGQDADGGVRYARGRVFSGS